MHDPGSFPLVFGVFVLVAELFAGKLRVGTVAKLWIGALGFWLLAVEDVSITLSRVVLGSLLTASKAILFVLVLGLLN